MLFSSFRILLSASTSLRRCCSLPLPRGQCCFLFLHLLCGCPCLLFPGVGASFHSFFWVLLLFFISLVDGVAPRSLERCCCPLIHLLVVLSFSSPPVLCCVSLLSLRGRCCFEWSYVPCYGTLVRGAAFSSLLFVGAVLRPPPPLEWVLFPFSLLRLVSGAP